MQLTSSARLVVVTALALGTWACSSDPSPSPSAPTTGNDAGPTPAPSPAPTTPPPANGLSQAIGAEGGTLAVAAGAALTGTSVVVPAGALAQTVTITVASSTTPVTAGTEQAAGPAVTFGPSGTTFTKPVTITLPFALPAGATASQLKVAVVEASGSRTEISAQSFTNGIATFQANGFTSFGVIVAAAAGACTSNSDCSPGSVCVNGNCAVTK